MLWKVPNVFEFFSSGNEVLNENNSYIYSVEVDNEKD